MSQLPLLSIISKLHSSSPSFLFSAMRKGYWTDHEDALLFRHIGRHGAAKWRIAGKLIGREGNSCGIRWREQLDPRIDDSDNTDEEGFQILLLRNQGLGWAEIARRLSEGRQGNKIRTANWVKNFWYKKKRAGELDHHILTGTTTDMPRPAAVVLAPGPALAHLGYDDDSLYANLPGPGTDWTLDDILPAPSLHYQLGAPPLSPPPFPSPPGSGLT